MSNEKAAKYLYRCVLFLALLLTVSGVAYTIAGQIYGIFLISFGILTLFLYDMGMRIRYIQEILEENQVLQDDNDIAE
jgi:hypothetical protein